MRLISAGMNLSEELQYATELARARPLVIEQYGKVGRLLKRNNEAVTDADRASQRLIVAGLRADSPGTELSARKTTPAMPSPSMSPIPPDETG